MAKLVAVKYIGKSDVFNMEVEDTHDFVTANGVVLHNCYDSARYIFMERPVSAKVQQKILEKPFNPLI